MYILVNNAGIGGGSVIARTATEDFDRVVQTTFSRITLPPSYICCAVARSLTDGDCLGT